MLPCHWAGTETISKYLAQFFISYLINRIAGKYDSFWTSTTAYMLLRTQRQLWFIPNKYTQASEATLSGYSRKLKGHTGIGIGHT
jgi:hypothetical protein